MPRKNTPLPPLYLADGDALLPVQRYGEVVGYTLVDSDKAEELAQWGWSCIGDGYTARRENRDGRLIHLYLHQVVLGVKSGDGVAGGVVDHIDGDISNNRFSNLRFVTNAVNGWNRRNARQDNFSCGILGVTWDTNRKEWMVQVKANRRKFHLGRYHNLTDASRVAECGRLLLHGTADGTVTPLYNESTPIAIVRDAARKMAAFALPEAA